MRDHPEDVLLQDELDRLRFYRWTDNSDRIGSRDVEQGLLRRIGRAEARVRERPGSADARYSLASAVSSLSDYYLLRKGPVLPLSLEAINRSIAIEEGLRAENPDVPEYARRLAHAYAQKAIILTNLGRHSESLDLELRIIDQLRSANRLEPTDGLVLYDLEGHLANLGEGLNHQGRYREALPFLEEAMGLKFSRFRDAYQLLHALTSARLGDLAPLERNEAAIRATLDARVGIETVARVNYWITHFDAACVHAALARLGDDDRHPTADRRRAARADYEQAQDHLEKARGAGDFQGINTPDEVRRDPTLDILRSDPRFRLLMMDLTFPADPIAGGR